VSNLATTTIGFGVVLILLGLGGYFGTGMVSLTALIPAVFGLLLVVFGAMARDDKKRKMAMHIAVTVGLLGFLGTVSGLVKIGVLLSGGEVARPAAVIAQSIMAVLMLVYVAMCVKSFIDARKKRANA
jgi:fluoride ion exporter CrcB/FEX